MFDAELKELAAFQHRKEEISDVKFSPSEINSACSSKKVEHTKEGWCYIMCHFLVT